MFSIGSRTAIPSGNLRFTSSRDFRTVFRESACFKSEGKKILIWPMDSIHESRIGTISILTFSPSTGGLIPGGKAWKALDPIKDESATCSKTSTKYESWGVISSVFCSLLCFTRVNPMTAPHPKSKSLCFIRTSLPACMNCKQ